MFLVRDPVPEQISDHVREKLHDRHKKLGPEHVQEHVGDPVMTKEPLWEHVRVPR